MTVPEYWCVGPYKNTMNRQKNRPSIILNLREIIYSSFLDINQFITARNNHQGNDYQNNRICRRRRKLQIGHLNIDNLAH